MFSWTAVARVGISQCVDVEHRPHPRHSWLFGSSMAAGRWALARLEPAGPGAPRGRHPTTCGFHLHGPRRRGPSHRMRVHLPVAVGSPRRAGAVLGQRNLCGTRSVGARRRRELARDRVAVDRRPVPRPRLAAAAVRLVSDDLIPDGIDAVRFTAVLATEAASSKLREDLLATWMAVTNAGGSVGFTAPADRVTVAAALDAALERVGAGRDALGVVRRAGCCPRRRPRRSDDGRSALTRGASAVVPAFGWLGGPNG